MLLSTNTIWYLLLFLLSAIVLTVTFALADNRGRVFGFFLIVFGVTLIVEQFLLFYTKAYTYYPRILTKAEYAYDDSVFGNLFSQLSVTAALTLVVTQRMGRVWYFIVAVVFGLIEEGFLALGIYAHHWYETWVTVAMLPVAFFTMELLYRWLLKGVPPFVYYGFMILGLFFPSLVFNWPLMLLSFLDTNTTLLGEHMASRYTFAISLYLLAAPAAMIAVLSRLKQHWKALAVALALGGSLVMKWLGLVLVSFWPFVIYLVLQFAYFCLCLWGLDKLLGHPLQNEADGKAARVPWHRGG